MARFAPRNQIRCATTAANTHLHGYHHFSGKPKHERREAHIVVENVHPALHSAGMQGIQQGYAIATNTI